MVACSEFPSFHRKPLDPDVAEPDSTVVVREVYGTFWNLQPQQSIGLHLLHCTVLAITKVSAFPELLRAIRAIRLEDGADLIGRKIAFSHPFTVQPMFKPGTVDDDLCAGCRSSLYRAVLLRSEDLVQRGTGA